MGPIIMEELILVKLGGSVITDKKKPYTARMDVIERLAREVHRARGQKDFKLIVGHGGGSFPHQAASKYQTQNGVVDERSYEGIAMVQNDAARLNRIVVDAFLRAGERAISVQLSSGVVTRNSKIVRWDTEAVKNMLSNRLLPVPYGDVAMDAIKGCSIISTEEIFSYLARALGVKRIILVGKVDGVLGSSGKVVPVISRKNFCDVKGCLQGSDGADVTGGMLHKVEMMLELAGSGIRSEVINGLTDGNLERALLGKDVLKTEIR